MTDDDFIGYALDLLDPAERAAVAARLAADPVAVARLDRVRAAVAPLEADRDDATPPPGLTLRTISRVAAYLVEHEPRQPEPVAEADGGSGSGQHTTLNTQRISTDRPEARFVGGRFRADLIVAAGIGLVAVGLALSFVSRVRYSNDLLACQNNLRTLHAGLAGYADVNAGRFPQVGREPYPTAGSFVSALADAGQCPPGFHPVCPAGPPPAPADRPSQPVAVAYTYSLGHRTPNGVVVGLWRSAEPGDEADLIPVSADYPAAAVTPVAGPTSPHQTGHNVLFAGGNVRFTTVSTVGMNGDDIYCNQLGRVAAGVDRGDAVLGRAGDRP